MLEEKINTIEKIKIGGKKSIKPEVGSLKRPIKLTNL